MIDDPSLPGDRPPEPHEPHRTPGPGWLAALRARLGLGEPPQLRAYIEDALRAEDSDASFPPAEREMLLRLLEFAGRSVADIMVPRADIIAIEEEAPLRELLETFDSAGVSRVPVFHETLDDPRDMIHIKDLFRWIMSEVRVPQQGDRGSAKSPASLDPTRCDLSRPVRVAAIRRPMLYVPPSMPASNLLIRMQAKRVHMALIVDEYGGTDGLVTIEDLVEQIVGDIEDEHDEAQAVNIVADRRGDLIASGRTPVDEIERRLGVKLLEPGEEEEIDTLGGLVFSLVGRLPSRGDRVEHKSGLAFVVLDADQRRLKTLRVEGRPVSRKAAGGPQPPARGS